MKFSINYILYFKKIISKENNRFVYFFQHDAASLSFESGGRLASVMNSVVSLRHQVRNYALLQDENSKKVSLM